MLNRVNKLILTILICNIVICCNESMDSEEDISFEEITESSLQEESINNDFNGLASLPSEEPSSREEEKSEPVDDDLGDPIVDSIAPPLVEFSWTDDLSDGPLEAVSSMGFKIMSNAGEAVTANVSMLFVQGAEHTEVSVLSHKLNR